jgi:hypothetical protein
VVLKTCLIYHCTKCTALVVVTFVLRTARWHELIRNKVKLCSGLNVYLINYTGALVWRATAVYLVTSIWIAFIANSARENGFVIFN